MKRMVEWKRLGDISTVSNGERPNSEILNNGNYQYINAGRTNSGYLNEYNSKGGAITTPSHGEGGIGSVLYQENNFWCGALCYKIYTHTEVISRYLFHYLSNNSDLIYSCKNVGGQPYINRKQLEKIIIGIPPLLEQNQIVDKLDTFTSSIDNLKQQIALRRKQYEYYRDQLLDLEGKEGVEMKTIGDLFVFKNGLNKEKKYFGEGTPIVNYTDVYHNKRLDSSILNGRVTLSENEIDRFRVHKGDVFFTRTSETPEEVGYAAVMLEEVESCTFSGFLLRARPITNLLLPEFCAYCFGSYKVRHSIVKYSTFTTRALTNGPSLSKISIPVPPLSEQQQIVDILDKFEASIQNLEAQLAEREKQYEYYRNKLLTFE